MDDLIFKSDIQIYDWDPVLNSDSFEDIEKRLKLSDFARWFRPMGISRQQKKNRAEDAFSIFGTVSNFFRNFKKQIKSGEFDMLSLFKGLSDGYSEVAAGRLEPDDPLIGEKTFLFPELIIGSTERMLTRSGYDTEGYTFSDKRAWFIGVEESSELNAYADDGRSAREGMKYKIWKTCEDEKVRPAHQAAAGQLRKLNEYFNVGGELLRYPSDPRASMKNKAGCRCWVEYSK